MVAALDVSAYIYSRLGWIDSWRLQKLTYYAQSWHLAWDGRPLFPDAIQAWPDGPVIPEVFRENKYGRDNPYSTTLPGANPSALPPEAVRMVDAVLAYYGEFSKDELIALTHDESPWQHARQDLPPGAHSSNEITTSSMRNCYTKKSLRGEDGPVRPTLAPPPTVSGENYALAAQYQIGRWKDTLDWLAER